MKKISLISILLALLIIGCNPRKERKTYFKVSGRIYTRNELTNYENKQAKRLKSKFNFTQVKVHEIIIDSTISHDSIIKTIKMDVSASIGKSPKEKIYSYLNKRLPAFTSFSLNNKKIDLSALNGKPTLLNFWFTTCQPCIDEMPALNQIMNKYKDKVNFISITFNNRKSVEVFLKTHKFNFEKVTGANEYINKLGIKHFPKNIFIDKNGIVRRVENGVPEIVKNGKLKPGNGNKFEEYIKSLL